MVEVPKHTGPTDEPMTWRPFGKNAIFICPNGHDGLLSTNDHQIADDGTVSPSVVCPYDCTFHEFVRLLEWTPPASDGKATPERGTTDD